MDSIMDSHETWLIIGAIPAVQMRSDVFSSIRWTGWWDMWDQMGPGFVDRNVFFWPDPKHTDGMVLVLSY